MADGHHQLSDADSQAVGTRLRRKEQSSPSSSWLWEKSKYKESDVETIAIGWWHHMGALTLPGFVDFPRAGETEPTLRYDRRSGHTLEMQVLSLPDFIHMDMCNAKLGSLPDSLPDQLCDLRRVLWPHWGPAPLSAAWGRDVGQLWVQTGLPTWTVHASLELCGLYGSSPSLLSLLRCWWRPE